MKETDEKQVFMAGTRLRLTPQQAAGKAHALRFIAGGVYELVAALQFEKDENIEVVAVAEGSKKAGKKAVKEEKGED